MSGSKPGERRGGRQKGAKNKATLAREEEARKALAGQLVAEIVDGTGPLKLRELPKEALVRIAIACEERAAHFKPVKKGENGATKNKAGDLALEGAFMDRAIICWSKAAPFYSPTYKAVVTAATTPAEAKMPAPQLLEHQPTDRQSREAAAQQDYLRVIKGGKAV